MDERVFDYPWKHLIPENPSLKIFRESWMKVFRRKPEEMIISYRNEEYESPALQYGEYCSHGGFGYFVEFPVLNKIDEGIDSDTNFFNKWGPGWGVDLNYKRYRYIDEKTGLPRRFEMVKAIEIIQNFFKNSYESFLFRHFQSTFNELTADKESKYIKRLRRLRNAIH